MGDATIWQDDDELLSLHTVAVVDDDDGSGDGGDGGDGSSALLGLSDRN